MVRGMPLHGGEGIERTPPQPSVFVCLADQAEQFRIKDALRGRAVVRIVESLRELSDVLRHETGAIAAVIVSTKDASGAMAAPVLREIVVALPNVAIIARCRAGIEHSSDIRALAAAGVHEFVFEGTDDSAAALLSALKSAAVTCACDAVMHSLRPRLPKELHRFAEYCLAYPAQATSVAAVAAMLGENRKTVFNHSRYANGSPPAELRAWCRLFLTAQLLTTTFATIEVIALDLEFPSGTSLRNMMKRYTGLTARQVRERGGLPCVMAAYDQRLTQPLMTIAGRQQLPILPISR